MNSLVVRVSKLVHFRPDFWTLARVVLNSLFPDVDVLCAFNDESNFSPISHVLLAAGPRSTRPTTTHRGHRPENPWHHVISRVSTFNPAHLSPTAITRSSSVSSLIVSFAMRASVMISDVSVSSNQSVQPSESKCT